MNKKKIIWGITGVLLIILIVLLTFSTEYVSKGEIIEFHPSLSDVVELADGSFLSLSHFYDMGYWAGINSTINYLGDREYLKDTLIQLDIEDIIDTMNANSVLFFEQYNKTNEYLDN